MTVSKNVLMALLILSYATWGGGMIAMKYAFESFTAMQVVFARVAFAGVIYLALYRLWSHIPYQKGDWKYLLAMVLFEPCLFFLCETFAMTYTTASQGGVIAACFPLCTAVAVVVMVRKKWLRNHRIYYIYARNGKMIKLVASDLDGTLLFKGAQSLPEEIFPLIRQLKKMGILFVAASGRQYANMKKMFRPVVDDMAFISENGGLAVYNEKVLYQDSFEQELVREIAENIYDKEGSEFTCSTKDFYYIRPKTEHFRDLMINVVGNVCKEINSFEEITEPCMKLAVYERGGLQDDTIHYWNERFGDKCTVVTSGTAWVDFIPFDTNKAKGVEKYQEILGIRPEECIVFGDEYNDIAMLKSVPYSFAMAHAKDGVKQAAAYETERVETILKKLITAKGNIEEVLK